jgi:hypothetical protein
MKVKKQTGTEDEDEVEKFNQELIDAAKREYYIEGESDIENNFGLEHISTKVKGMEKNGEPEKDFEDGTLLSKDRSQMNLEMKVILMVVEQFHCLVLCQIKIRNKSIHE